MINALNSYPTLHNVLVAEFRASQTLYTQLTALQTALVQEEAVQIIHLSVTIETALEHLRQLRAARECLFDGQTAITTNLLTSGCFVLLAGINVLNSQIAQAFRCNSCLALAALERSNHIQTRLAEYFNPLGAFASTTQLSGAHKSLPAMLSAILSARDALCQGDMDAVSTALADLQSNLQSLAQLLQPELPAGAENTFIEKIANLYRQSHAYRVVLQSI